MPAIITDQYRILNAETFIDSFVGIGTTGNNNYYTFLGHPDPTNDSDFSKQIGYGVTTWRSDVPDPVDSFKEENLYHDTMLFLKKITPNDVRRIVPRIDWETGTSYDMYRNNYNKDNKTPITEETSLYAGSYYVVNSEFKVYLCINNGTDQDNQSGRKSEYEPNFIDTIPQPAGDDGYLWKYLFTISPSDIVKFVTPTYIPLPVKWGDTSTEDIKNAAVDGKIETVLLKSTGSGYSSKPIGGAAGTDIATFSINVPIIGDGEGGLVEISVDGGVIISMQIANGGTGYTYGLIRFEDGVTDSITGLEVTGGSGATFEVVIPPKGGHGADIYRELGGFRVMVHSRFDNNVNDVPDYIINNDFSRVGIVKNPIQFGGTDLLNSTTATNLSALKLKPADGSGISTSSVDYIKNSKITQTISTAGIGSTAAALVASWDRDTGILKYYQPVTISSRSEYSYKKLDFVGLNTAITGGVGGNLVVDVGFGATTPRSSITLSDKNVDLGQSFVKGKANPDVKKYSGDIIYIDNRAPITRSTSQKEEVKIVIEF